MSCYARTRKGTCIMNSLNDKVRMFVKPTTRDGKMSMVYGDT